MTAWPKRSLGEICDIRIGRTPPRREQKYWGTGQAWLSIADMNQGRDLWTTSEQITDTAVQEVMGSPVAPGTVALSFKLSIGKVGIVRTPMFTNEAIATLPIKDHCELTAEYLYWALRSTNLTRETDDAVMGKTLNKAKLARIQISIPPVCDQYRIVEELDQVDELRTKRRQALALLDELAQSIFLDMFGDPVSNPRNLKTCTLPDLGRLDRGISKHRPRNDPKLLGGPYPFVQTGDVANSDGYIRSHKETYSETGLRQSKLWPAGTLCITIAANIARTGILQFDACFPDSVVGFISDIATTEYVQSWFKFVQQRIETLAAESTQKNINLKVLRTLPIPVPPHELIELFARRLTAVRATAQDASLQLTDLDELFESLQTRAFSGEL